MNSPDPPQEDPETKARRLREQARAEAMTLRETQARLTGDTNLRRRLYGESASLFPGGASTVASSAKPAKATNPLANLILGQILPHVGMGMFGKFGQKT